MKAVILAGGLGTRLSEETAIKPKPIVEIGGRPILWHIMKNYSWHGVNDFVICLGYKGYLIKEYFANYFLHMSDVTFDMKKNKMEVHRANAEPWSVTLVDTGDTTQTGGRLKRIASYLEDDDFCFTYGDGVADIDIGKLIQFHKAQGTLATVTSVQPLGRFGALDIAHGKITGFKEKPQGDGAWISGGFFVLSPRIMTILITTIPYGNVNLLKVWRAKANFLLSNMMVFGSPWIPCVIKFCSKNYGPATKHLGKFGNEGIWKCL